ncbi:cuticle protein AM1199-like [Panulirus ornatus]|uniref:cuticle protein AM1199-like n=1 Tax=Panulirus ornatus TaxID=150431 RepID=UPI003A860FC5
MKLVFLLPCLVAVSLAVPFRRPIVKQVSPSRHFAILSDNRHDQGDGNFRYDFETENGIFVQAVGRPGSKGQSNIDGSFRFPFPDGGVGELTYVADENGYRADSPLLPTPHPLPDHAIKQILFAEQEQGRGGRGPHQTRF